MSTESYWEALEVERSKHNKLYSNSMQTSFWTNPIVHAVVVVVVLLGGWAVSSGGEWQTITLGAIATGIISFLHGKALLGKR